MSDFRKFDRKNAAKGKDFVEMCAKGKDLGPPASRGGGGNSATAKSMAYRRLINGLPTPAESDFSFENASWGSSVSSGRNSQKLGKARSLLEF